MTVYTLDEAAPEFPENDTYWVAPSAVLIGRVRLLKRWNRGASRASC